MATLAELPYTYYELGKNDDYIKYAQKVYQAYLGVYGENHAATLEKYNFLGTAYGKTGKYFKALKVLNKAYKKCQNVLGDFAPETILVLENIAAIYTKLGFRITAKILYNTVRKRKLGLY